MDSSIYKPSLLSENLISDDQSHMTKVTDTDDNIGTFPDVNITNIADHKSNLDWKLNGLIDSNFARMNLFAINCCFC